MQLAIIDATDSRRPPLGGPGSTRYGASIANAPLISHVFDELARAGIKEATVVAEENPSRELRAILGDGAAWGITVTWSDADGGGRDAVLAETVRALRDGAVLLHPGDSLFRSQLRAMRERFRTGDVDAVLPEQAAVGTEGSGAHRVCDTAVMLGPETIELLDELGSGGDAQGLVGPLLHSECRLAVVQAGEHWTYDESLEGLLTANRLMLDALPSSPPLADLEPGSEVSGRVSIDPSALISSSVLHGPVAIGAGAVVEDSFLGPYTAIAAGTVISGVEIDNSMVLAGAEVRHPDCRIEGSIIGERSRVVRSFALPRGMHLRLGPDSRITLS